MAQSDEQLEKRSGRKGKSKPGGGNGAVWKGFLDCELTSHDKEILSSLDIELEYPPTDWLWVVTQGYKVSMSQDKKNHSYICSMTDVDESSGWCGYTLTGRGSTPQKAWAALMYKHRTKMPEGWVGNVQAASDWG